MILKINNWAESSNQVMTFLIEIWLGSGQESSGLDRAVNSDSRADSIRFVFIQTSTHAELGLKMPKRPGPSTIQLIYQSPSPPKNRNRPWDHYLSYSIRISPPASIQTRTYVVCIWLFIHRYQFEEKKNTNYRYQLINQHQYRFFCICWAKMALSSCATGYSNPPFCLRNGMVSSVPNCQVRINHRIGLSFLPKTSLPARKNPSNLRVFCLRHTSGKWIHQFV